MLQVFCTLFKYCVKTPYWKQCEMLQVLYTCLKTVRNAAGFLHVFETSAKCCRFVPLLVGLCIIWVRSQSCWWRAMHYLWPDAFVFCHTLLFCHRIVCNECYQVRLVTIAMCVLGLDHWDEFMDQHGSMAVNDGSIIAETSPISLTWDVYSAQYGYSYQSYLVRFVANNFINNGISCAYHPTIVFPTNTIHLRMAQQANITEPCSNCIPLQHNHVTLTCKHASTVTTIFKVSHHQLFIQDMVSIPKQNQIVFSSGPFLLELRIHRSNRHEIQHHAHSPCFETGTTDLLKGISSGHKPFKNMQNQQITESKNRWSFSVSIDNSSIRWLNEQN